MIKEKLIRMNLKISNKLNKMSIWSMILTVMTCIQRIYILKKNQQLFNQNI